MEPSKDLLNCNTLENIVTEMEGLKKITFAIFIILFFVSNGMSQQLNAFSKYSKTVCECLTTQKSKIKTREDIEKAIDSCSYTVDENLLLAVQKEQKIPKMNEEGAAELAKLLGADMMINCASFYAIISSKFENAKSVEIPKKPVLDSASNAMCDCIYKKKEKIRTKQTAVDHINLCIKEVGLNYLPKFKTVYKITDSNDEALISIGEAWTKLFMANCIYYRDSVLPLL